MHEVSRHNAVNRKVIHNTSWNILGGIIPILVSLVTIPFIIKGFGIERFGMLTIAWVVVGYFGHIDFGLGRATIRFMANAWNEKSNKSAVGFFCVSFCLSGLLGIIGGAILAIITPWLVGSLLKIPLLLKEELIGGFFWLSFCIPIVTAGSSLVGALESQNRFRLINTVQISTDLLIKVVPLAILPFTQKIDVVIAAIVILRLVSFFIYMFLCVKNIPAFWDYVAFYPKLVWPLFNFGGWLTVTNIVGPLMTYMDRFVVGSVLSMKAVAYYATPYDLITKMQILPTSLSRTLFPIFSTADQVNADSDHASLYEKSIKYLIIFMIPVAICMIILAHDLLFLWLGHEFAVNSKVVVQVLAVGALINATAKPPYVLIQGLGRPDITAKLHLIEFPFYVLMIYLFLNWLGIIGVAIAWTLRVIADTLLLRIYASRLLKKLSSTTSKDTLFASEVSAFVLIGSACVFSMLDNFFWRLCAIIILNVIFVFWVWHKILSNEEKLYLNTRVSHYLMKF